MHVIICADGKQGDVRVQNIGAFSAGVQGITESCGYRQVVDDEVRNFGIESEIYTAVGLGCSSGLPQGGNCGIGSACSESYASAYGKVSSLLSESVNRKDFDNDNNKITRFILKKLKSSKK